MQNSDFDQFSKILFAICEVYNKKATPILAEIYFKALSQYDLPVIGQAFSNYLVNPDNGQFMPKPADIVRMIGGTSLDASMQAWAKVDKAVRHVGPWSSVVFDDPLIHVVLTEMGGWVALGSKNDDEWPFVQREFENRYKGYAHRKQTPDYVPVLRGIADTENTSNGYNTDEIRMVGDESKALRVMQGGKAEPLQLTTFKAIGRTIADNRAEVEFIASKHHKTAQG